MIFLKARWQNLVMVNFRCDPEILRKRVPAGTELDLWHGECLVSLVGFDFRNTKVFGISLPGHQHFLEVNLRFYIRRKVDGKWRRAVAFVKEIVPKHLIAFVARTLYREPYVALPMSSEEKMLDEGKALLAYRWQNRKDSYELSVEYTNQPSPMFEGSEAEFIAEHYWGYTQFSPTVTREYEVKHPPWRVFPVVSHNVQGDFARLYGSEFQGVFEEEPTSVFLAEGSEVSVSVGRSI